MAIVTVLPADLLFAFARFVADPALGRLYHSGQEVPLTPKAFRVLMVLIERCGERVEKDELFRQVWPDTFVEQNNLARNVSMIRKALHELDPEQEFIGTVPGRGYRFVVPVARIRRSELTPWHTGTSGTLSIERSLTARDGGSTPPMPADSSSVPIPDGPVLAPGGPMSRTVAAGIAAVLLLGLTWTVATSLESPVDQAPERKLWQLTTRGRLEGDPTWSPDGRRVAYSSDRSGHFNIWVQPVSEGTAIQLTSGAARDWQPSWSPNGRHVAFRSERDGGGLFIVPAEGGREHRISTFGHEPRWSPDGARVLFWDSRDAYIVGLDGTPPTKITADALSGAIGRVRIGWHPDNRRISVYATARDGAAAFWTVPVDGGARVHSGMSPGVVKRLADAGLRLGSFVWSPAGDMLYFEGRSEETENLWRIRVDPQSLEWVAGPERLTTGSSLESGLALSPDGTRLAFGSRVESTRAWSMPFDPVSGRITGAGEPVTPDGANAEILDMSPDGSQLAYRVSRRNRHELWIRSLEFGQDRLRTVEPDAAIVQPRWSRDGTQLAYLRRPANGSRDAAIVLLAADDQQGERVLRSSSSPEMVYDWSADGESLLVRCRAPASQWAICRLPSSAAAGTIETRLIAADARQNLYAAKSSPDERWVSFIGAPDPTRSTVFVSPAAGGAWVRMTEGRHFEDKPRWSPDGRTLYFLSNRTGFWNLWGRRFDSRAGVPVGDPFQVSHFDTSARMVRSVSDMQIAITRERLILPITQSSGVIWVLDNVNR